MRTASLLALLPLAAAFEYNVLLDETIRAYEHSRLSAGETEPDQSCGKLLMERLGSAPNPADELQEAMSSGRLLGGCPITAVSSAQPALETFSSTINEWAKEVVSELHASKSCGFTMEEVPTPTAKCELVFLDEDEMEKAMEEDLKKREEMMKKHQEQLKKATEEAKAEDGDKEADEKDEETKKETEAKEEEHVKSDEVEDIVDEKKEDKKDEKTEEKMAKDEL